MLTSLVMRTYYLNDCRGPINPDVTTTKTVKDVHKMLYTLRTNALLISGALSATEVPYYLQQLVRKLEISTG